MLGYLILSLGVIAGFFYSSRVDEKHCQHAAVNRAAIRTTIIAGDPTLLKPGDPGYDYWKNHPAESKKAHERIHGKNGTLDRFPPIKC